MRPFVMLAALLTSGSVLAQDANALRGGWLADTARGTEVYLLVVRGESVTGTRCIDLSLIHI